jgi:hypothetical protein
MLLQHCHCIFYAKVSCHPNVVGFPNQIHLLALWNENMDHMAQNPILKMEINDSCFNTQHLVGGGEVGISLIELGPSIGLVAAGF